VRFIGLEADKRGYGPVLRTPEQGAGLGEGPRGPSPRGGGSMAYRGLVASIDRPGGLVASIDRPGGLTVGPLGP